MQNFATLDDIFDDAGFEDLVAGIKPARIERLDPDIEKFLEIVDWVRENGREPQKSTNLKERSLFSRLKGMREQADRRAKLQAYDDLGLLGETDDRHA